MDYDEEHTRDVYAHYGLAMYLAQVLEHGIVNALVILSLAEKGKYTRNDIDKFMEGQFEKTLGGLIKHLRSEAVLSLNLESNLSLSLNRRNVLAHSYFREKAEMFVTRTGRDEVLQELKNDQTLFENTDEQLSEAVKAIREKHGVTDSIYEAEYNLLCEKLGITP